MPEPTYVTIPDLTAAQDAQVNDNMLIEAAVVDQNEQSGYSSRKVTRGQLLSELKEDLTDIEEQISGGMGVSEALKAALLQLATKVAYIDQNGQDYYDDLYDALYPSAPPATLVSISAEYTQSGTVYDTDSLDSLKSDLVVTALYDDQTTAIATDYTLSGTLAEGISTITVSYGGTTPTFSVTVTADALYPLAYGSYTIKATNDLGTITVSKGAKTHVKIEFPNAVTLNGGSFTNLTSMLSGTSGSEILNNKPLWFTIPSGVLCELKLENPINTTGKNFAMNFRKALAATSLSWSLTDGQHTTDETISQTLQTAEDASCLFTYMQANTQIPANSKIEFDITFTVDGIRYF